MFKKFLLVSLCFIPYLANASTLKDVLTYTYENSWSINAERAGLKATDEEVAIAKSGFRPNVVAVGSAGRTYNKNSYDYTPIKDEKYLNPTSVGLQLKQPVFSGFSTVQSVNAAKSQVRAGQQSLAGTEQNVLLDAVTVYMDNIRDEAVLDLRKNNEKVLKQHLASYRKRYKVGDLTRTDVAQSEARLSGATAHRIAAEGNLKASRANFFSVVGLEPVDLKDIKTIDFDLPVSLDQAIEIAMENSPQIKAAKYAKDAASYTVKAKKGTLLPQVDVTAATGRQHEQLNVDKADYWQVHANLTIPLYQSGAEYANVRQARQLENKYRILWDKTVQDVRAMVIAAWETYTASKAQVSSIEAQIKASKMALDGVIREAKVGSRTVLDVLDAEQEHLDNQVSLVQTHRDEIVSAYTLLAALGQLNPDTLKLDVESYDAQAYYQDVKNKWIGYDID
ncbi:MAG: TolC family outer membrane protein [Alphaproteobacteria bacterium]|nr:TolC family outer membrane protein [Alphaproteobacteria bacterium]